MPRVVQVQDVPGVEAAIASGDPVLCVRRISEILRAGADRRDVERTAALVAARHFRVTLPPPHALLAFGAALQLAARSDNPRTLGAQACALAASEWRLEAIPGAAHAISGDELHLGRSFQVAVRAADPLDADAIFSGLLREGEERRFAGDTLFEACAQDLAGDGHKLILAVGSWRLARSLGWLRAAPLLRPAVHLAASVPQDLSEFSAILREVGRSRLDLELAGRNVAPIDAVARNGWQIALNAGPDRVVAELINGLRRGRAPAGYMDLVAETAMERLAVNEDGLEPALFACAARFVVGYSHTSSRVLALMLAARAVARVPASEVPEAARIADPDGALHEFEEAIEAGDARGAVRLARGLADALEPDVVLRLLERRAGEEDAHANGGHLLLCAAWISEFAANSPGPACAALAAVLARAPKSRTVSSGL